MEQERGGGAGLLEQVGIRGWSLARAFLPSWGPPDYASAWFLLLSQVMQPTKEWLMPSRDADTEFPGTDGGYKARMPQEISSWPLITINQKL